MKRPISDIAFTSAVKQAQEKRGSRKAYARMEQQGRQGPWQDIVTPELAEFIGERDSLYLGTAQDRTSNAWKQITVIQSHINLFKSRRSIKFSITIPYIYHDQGVFGRGSSLSSS